MTEFFSFKNKFFCKVNALLFLFIIHWSASAQKNEAAYAENLFKKIADTSSRLYTPSNSYYIINWREVKPVSLKVVRQLGEKTAIVQLTSQAGFDSINRLAKIAAANDQWKLTSAAQQLIEKSSTVQKVYILSTLQLDKLLDKLKRMKDPLTIVDVDEASHAIVVKTNGKFIKDHLLALKEIIFIDLRAEPYSEINIIGYNRSFHGLNAVDYSIPGAIGKNIVVGMKEQKMDETDLDLYKRVLPSAIASSNVTNHATVVSSIIGGAGNSFYTGKGIAWGCKFFPSSFANLFADDAIVLNSNKVTVQNHSYGTIIQQFYGAEAVSYDAYTWANKNFVPVFSAGNMGAAAATDGQYANIPGYANLTGNFKMAKNIITVGAIDNKGNIPDESSAGPLYDGRVAPQIIALGPNGTSDAAAIVSGTIAVMQQVYADSNSQSLPSASLTKAILYNSTEDIFHTGIDYKTGYGLLNSFASVKAIQQKEYDGGLLAQGQQWTKIITVPANAAQLKVTMAWTDSAATLNNNKALINDLDLEVQDLTGNIIYKPWVLNATAKSDSLAKLPVRKRDSLNTTEQVSISLPTAGNYKLKVSATDITASSIAFNIAYHIDTLNTFTFTSPQHASDVNLAENPDIFIRWKTFVADTNQTGNLYISYNNGTDWQLLKASYKIFSNYFLWPAKDTSSAAILKMETSFGSFLSKNFIISKVARINTDFFCSDSVGLSWNKHIYATAYKLYAFTDSTYLKHIITTTDTFIVLKRAQYPSLIYAIEPVLSNGLPAARSSAQNITQQGVKCFYKTFYHNLLDQNKLDLILELSAAGYVDSLFFEQLNMAGQLLKNIGDLKVNNPNLIYHQLVNDVPGGTSYWRVKIKLKNGSVVYTDIISILTSGKRYLLFYPNPASRNSSVTWILQQGLSSDCRLQLFDITGHMLKNYLTIPNHIDLGKLAPGLIVYKLFGSDNRLLETGKLIIK